MLRFTGAVALVGMMALGVYGGAVLLFPTLLPTVTQWGAASNLPLTINHQGVVSVNGTRPTANANFYFALVDPDTGNNVWTNDGTNIGNSDRPTTPVNLAITDGVFSTRLGDVGTGMVAMSPTDFADGNLRLRVWVDAGQGIQQLSPDQPLSSVPYAFRADTVSPGSIGAAQLADGAVDSDKLASSIAVWSKDGSNATWSGAIQTAGLFGGLGDVVQDSKQQNQYTATYGGSPGNHPFTEFNISLTLPRKSVVMQAFTGNRVRVNAGECYPQLFRNGVAVNNSFIPADAPTTGSLAMHNMVVLNAGSYTFQAGIFLANGWHSSTWKMYGGTHTVIAIPIKE